MTTGQSKGGARADSDRARSDADSGRRWTGLVSAGLLTLGIAASFLGGRSVLEAQVRSPEPAGARPDCVEAYGEARLQAYGYNHVLVIRNRCPTAQRCTVSSNVNPADQQVELDPGEQAEVMLWRDSPARTFQSRVDCADR